ncbi:hypothetical protein D3C75_839990 [compost metagenome]
MRQAQGDRAAADDRQLLVAHIADAVVEVDVLVRLVAGMHLAHQAGERGRAAEQFEDHRQAVFGHRVGGIARHARHLDAVGLAVVDIDDVAAGEGQRDHLQPGQLAQVLFTQRHAAGQRHGGVLQVLQHLVGVGVGKLLPAVLAVRALEAGGRRQAFVVEEDDMFAHGIVLIFSARARSRRAPCRPAGG